MNKILCLLFTLKNAIVISEAVLISKDKEQIHDTQVL